MIAHCWHIEIQLTFVYEFCILQLCWIHSLVLTVLVESLGFPIYNIMSSENRNFPFWFGCPLFPFLASLLWLGLPVLCWLKVVRLNTPVLIMILEEKTSVFHHWAWCYLWAYDICPYYIEVLMHFLYAQFVKIFIMRGYWILSNVFPAST